VDEDVATFPKRIKRIQRMVKLWNRDCARKEPELDFGYHNEETMVLDGFSLE